MVDVKGVAFNFVDRLRDCGSPEQVLMELSAASGSLGYQYVAVTGLPDPYERLDKYILLTGWPPGWSQRYREGNYARFDPVIRTARQATMPFKWNEAAYDRSDSDAVRVMREAERDFGMANGVTVPIYTARGTQAIVSFACNASILREDSLPALHLVAIYAHSRIIAIRDRLAPARSYNRPSKLAPREIECLKWTADGKTAWEIATILSLAERTVREYLDSAAKKLGAVNRPQAVAEAIRRDILF
jgi:LuxR family quorum sensing-dependent transcriptional regulator